MSNRSLKTLILIVSIFSLPLLSACDDEPALPDNVVIFESTELGFEGDDTEVKITLSRAASTDVPVTISLAPERVTYGTEFTTEPDGTSGTLTLIIPAGSAEASFRVIKPSSVFLNGDEHILFTITSVEEPVLPGESVATKLIFSAITSEGAQLQLSGKTDVSPYANSVFADLSANKQTTADRKSWNLGFYNGEDFRLILNHAYQTTAAPLDKTDINAVVLTDADKILNLNHDLTDPNTLPLSDYWDGDLTKTTFSAISDNDAENKVYLLSFEGSKEKDQWYKVKVNRKEGGYTVQYARITETTIRTIDVPKDPAYNFTFVSLETDKIVAVEPVKTNWDIEWSYSTFNSGLNTPYWFQDFVLLNYAGGAEASEVVKADAAEAETAYTSFGETDITGLVFLKTRDAIGSKWRSTGGPGGVGTGIKRDRFYIIRDSHGNVYKLKFVSMGLGNDGGERGRPVIEYKLVKKAE
jgi:hypothetical protein